jgi:methionyl-tRNA formyltransferase
VTGHPKTAIVFGKGRVAVKATQALIKESYEIRYVVPSSSHLAGDVSFGDWAADQGLAVLEPARLDDLPSEKVDLGISVYFDRIFRQRHIDRFRLLVNVHNSVLPSYRGVRPINWALKNGERSHGVSLHRITIGIDEGPVFGQEVFPIDPASDEVRDIYTRCLSAAEKLLERTLPTIWDLVPVAQEEALASYYSASDDEELGDRRYWSRADTRLK